MAYLAMKMLEDDTTLATAHNSNAETALHVLARRPLEFGGRNLLWETDDENRTMFHVAVLYRHASIFNLVHETGSIKDIIVTYTDDENNNILHLAAKLAPQNQLNLVSGAALQMQRELVWFELHEIRTHLSKALHNIKYIESKSNEIDWDENFNRLHEVKKIVQPLSIDMKNKDGKTPRELFTSEHEGLLCKGESWMKNTANSCMLVATIITTVVFSAAFSIPGGIADDTGAPKFLKDTAFLIFVISDGVALFSSSTSTLMFLYILTSRCLVRFLAISTLVRYVLIDILFKSYISAKKTYDPIENPQCLTLPL
ncbi:Ankyrin repeat family protein, partial [Prunus dulcis]